MLYTATPTATEEISNNLRCSFSRALSTNRMVLLFATGFSKYINDEFYTRHAVCSTVFISFGISMFQAVYKHHAKIRENKTEYWRQASARFEIHLPTMNTALHTHSLHFRPTERAFRCVRLCITYFSLSFLFVRRWFPHFYNDEICIQSNKFARASNALQVPPIHLAPVAS